MFICVLRMGNKVKSFRLKINNEVGVLFNEKCFEYKLNK